MAQRLEPHWVKTDLHAATKEEVIPELLTFFCDTDQLPRRHFNQVLQEIKNREDCISTGFTGGLAIPHARVEYVNEPVFVNGIYAAGIAFDALDGITSHVFVLTLSPADKPTPHLEFSAEIAGAFQRCGREQILASNNTDEIYDMLIQSPHNSRHQ